MTRQEAEEWKALYKPKTVGFEDYEPQAAPKPEKKPVKPIIQFPVSERKEGKP